MKTISRRALLRGAGAALGLPLLDAMRPAALGAAAAAPPVRLFFYLVGGGAYLPYWTLDGSARSAELEPKKSVEHLGPPIERNEALDTLSPTLEPLHRFKKDLLVLGGLTLSSAFGFEDGHSAEVGALLTGAIFSREKLQAGISVDQVAARAFEGKTWLDALVLGLNGGRPGGAKGLGRVYAQHYSWRSATTPTGEERNPKLVFDRLFRGRLDGGNVRRNADLDVDRRSVLDAALEEAKRLQSSLGGSDRHKLDEYLTSVRDVEKRIEFASKREPDADAPAFNAGDLQELQGRIPPEKGIPESYAEYDRLMIDLIALAFQTDTTRVAMLSHTGYRAYPEVGVKRGHHDLQHHEGDPEKREELRKVDRYNVGLYAYALEKFGSVKEGEGSLLDQSMLMYGSGMSNGNRHSRENLPILLGGRAGGTLKPGRYVDYNWKKMTPLSNLYVEILNRMGIATTKFGDSTGGLAHLA
jgi:hypothetical protein